MTQTGSVLCMNRAFFAPLELFRFANGQRQLLRSFPVGHQSWAGPALGPRQFLFVAMPFVGVQLWVTDGTPTRTLALRTLALPTSPANVPPHAVAGGLRFCAADDGVHGQELWCTDGTVAGTRLVADLHPGFPGSYLAAMAPAGSGTRIVFQASDGVHGNELWCSVGTASGTRLLADVEAGAGGMDPRAMIRVGTTIFFSASNTSGRELWSIP
jgi:ELWxxDGT repeat protein